MDRRKAIVSLTTALGYTVTFPSIVSLSNACKSKEPMAKWTPSFFQPEDANLIDSLAGALLPKTDTPGALEVGAQLFVDKFLHSVAKPADQDLCMEGLSRWKTQLASGSSATFETISNNLSSYFDIDPSKQDQISDLMKAGIPAAGEKLDEFYIYSFLMMFKKLLMLGYFASEEIGENVLSYLPVPGKYEGCIPVETVGNSWAL